MNNWEPFKHNLGRLLNGTMGAINTAVVAVDDEIEQYKKDRQKAKEKTEYMEKLLAQLSKQIKEERDAKEAKA